MFQYLPFSEANPLAYPIEDALYGATVAYPNLLPEQLTDELALARELGVRIVEVTETPDVAVAQRLFAEFAGQDCLQVVLPDGRMRVIRSEIRGRATTHTMASAGADVIAAGHVLFGSTGRATRWNHMSGHYRPHARQAREVAEAIFVLARLCEQAPVVPVDWRSFRRQSVPPAIPPGRSGLVLRMHFRYCGHNQDCVGTNWGRYPGTGWVMTEGRITVRSLIERGPDSLRKFLEQPHADSEFAPEFSWLALADSVGLRVSLTRDADPALAARWAESAAVLYEGLVRGMRPQDDLARSIWTKAAARYRALAAGSPPIGNTPSDAPDPRPV